MSLHRLFSIFKTSSNLLLTPEKFFSALRITFGDTPSSNATLAAAAAFNALCLPGIFRDKGISLSCDEQTKLNSELCL